MITQNIQTGNQALIDNGHYVEKHSDYLIFTETSADETIAAVIRSANDEATVTGYPCVDDALDGLAETPLAQQAKWYAPQFLGL